MPAVRYAGLKDIDRISSLLAASWKFAYRKVVHSDYLDSIKDDHWVKFLTVGLSNNDVFAMVMECNQEIIGAAILSKAEKENCACLISFYLLPDKIGRGFGHIFWGEIEAELRRRGFSKCVLDVLANNERAIGFYGAHGFVQTGRETKAMLGEREYTCMIFEKALSPEK